MYVGKISVMALFAILILAIVILYLLYYFSKSQRELRRISSIIDEYGGARRLPIIGTALEAMRCSREDLYAYLMRRNATYGPIYRSYLGSDPIVHIMKARHVEPLLRSSVNITKGNMYDFVRGWLGEGLITSTGQKWFHHRKLITPTFHFKILDNFSEVFAEKALYLTGQIAKKANGKFFDIYPYITHCTLDIICETAMGVPVNAMQNAENSEYVQSLHGLVESVIHRIFHPYLHPPFIFKHSSHARQQQEYLKVLHGFTNKVIKEKKSKLLQGGYKNDELKEEDILMGKKKRMAFLDLLLEANSDNAKLSDEDLREEVDTFMFAGHDTTTASTCWALFCIANYPDVQKKIHEELDEVFGGDDRAVTPEDLVQLKYLDRVFKETLRRFPVVPTITRRLTEDVVLDGKLLPSGVIVVINLSTLLMDPEQFDDPEKFDPDRFLPDVMAERHPYAYIPFSAGPRNCIGQKFASRNSKTMLATILRKFNVTAESTLKTIKMYSEIVLKPQNGMYLAFESRKR